MNRRSLLKGIAVAAGAAGAGLVGGGIAGPYGRMTLDRWERHLEQTGEFLHVYVDGVDVTQDCFEADDIAGYALVYCRDQARHADVSATGSFHVDETRDKACALRITGTVSMRPGVNLRDQLGGLKALNATHIRET